MPVSAGAFVADAALVPPRDLLRFPAVLCLHVCRRVLSFLARLARTVAIHERSGGPRHAGRSRTTVRPGRPVMAEAEARPRSRRSPSARFRRELHRVAGTGQLYRTAAVGPARN